MKFGVSSVSNQMKLDLCDELKSKLLDLNVRLNTEIEELNKQRQSNSLGLALTELSDYSFFFKSIVNRIERLFEIMNGSSLFDSESIKFYSTLSKTSSNFLSFMDKKLSTSSQLRDFLSKNDPPPKFWLRIDPGIFFNSRRVVTSLLYEIYNQERKSLDKTKLQGLSRMFKSEKVFSLQVIDIEQDLKSECDDGLLIENVFVSNAHYEMMSKSFQPVAKKCVNKLGLVKMKPLFEDFALYQQKENGETYKYAPFIDRSTYEVICLACIKFWQSASSSLSSTMSGHQTDANSPPAAATTTSKEVSKSTAPTYNHIPFYAPVYFYVQSDDPIIKDL